MARPVLEDGEGKTARVEIRVRPEQKLAWQEAASDAAKPLSAWAEALLDTAAAKSQGKKRAASTQSKAPAKRRKV